MLFSRAALCCVASLASSSPHPIFRVTNVLADEHANACRLSAGWPSFQRCSLSSCMIARLISESPYASRSCLDTFHSHLVFQTCIAPTCALSRGPMYNGRHACCTKVFTGREIVKGCSRLEGHTIGRSLLKTAISIPLHPFSQGDQTLRPLRFTIAGMHAVLEHRLWVLAAHGSGGHKAGRFLMKTATGTHLHPVPQQDHPPHPSLSQIGQGCRCAALEY